MIFDYPTASHSRRHGPTGYRDYTSFKDWLRDDFTFRCVFCLIRERWHPNDADAFSVEHFKPQRTGQGILDYDNLYYSCLTCNSTKRAVWPLADPCTEAFSKHLRVLADGNVEGLSKQGIILLRTLKLNEPRRVDYRYRILTLFLRLQASITDPAIRQLFRGFFGFPDSLPDLRTYRPKSNRRANGVHNCYFVLREKGQLPETY